MTILACFPKRKLTMAMQNFAYDLEHRKIHGAKPSDTNLEFMKGLHLFIPKNLLDTTRVFWTYCILLDILFGKASLNYRAIKNLRVFVENLETVFDRTSSPAHLIVMMLYGMDVQLQLLLKTISKDGTKPMPREAFKAFIDFLDTMQKDMMVGRYTQEVPPIYSRRSDKILPYFT
jgi:hypothetical protein